MILPPVTPHQWRITRRWLLAVAVGSLLWEVGHVPLYTLWLSGTPADIAYAVIHCTLGDILIATISFALALALIGTKGWPGRKDRAIALATILAAVGYTVFSEWMNVEIRGTWAYRDLMPRLPPLGTGLTPILQWIVVPALAFWWAGRAGDDGRNPTQG